MPVPWPCRTCVVDLAGTRVHGLEKLVDLLLRHFLSQIGKNIFELTNADKARHVLVEDLETSTIFFGLARVAEPPWSIQDALE